MPEHPRFEELMEGRRNPKPDFDNVAGWLMLGVICAPIAIVLSMGATFGLETGVFLAIGLLPYAVAVVSFEMTAVLVLAILQYPLYGLVIGLAARKGPRSRKIAVVCLVAMNFAALVISNSI